MAGTYIRYPNNTASGGSGNLSSISFSIGLLDGLGPNPFGASVSSNSVFMQTFTSVFPGLVSSASQTFGGIKTFNQPIGLQVNGSFSLASGQLVFDNSAQGLTFQNTVASISLQIGQEEWVQVQNTSGATIGNGQAVYIAGSAPNLDTPTVGLALATTVSTSALLGVATHDIANGAIGYVTQRGKVHGINTAAYSPGQRVWLSTASAGFFQVTDPLPPNFSIFVGYVLDVGSTTGSLFLSGIRTGSTVPFVNPITTSGDLIVGSGSSAAVATRVARGLPGTILTLSSGSLIQSWQTLNAISGSASGAAYVVGALNGAQASINGAVIGSSSLFLQSASTTNPGLMVVASTQSFTGIKSFTQVGINNTSGNAGLFVVSSGLATNSLTIQGLSGQTSLGLNIIDNSNNPKVVYDFNAGAFRLFVNPNEAAECNFDNRATVVTGAISSGSAARFNFICADQSAVGAGKGGGIAFGASQTGSTTITEFGYVWATKNNANAGDLDGTLHLASRNNASGKAQRGIDIDQNGNSILFGQVQMAGALNGQINLSAGSSVATYTVTMPSAQSSGSCMLNNNGFGSLTWQNRYATAPTVQFFTTKGAQTYTLPANCIGLRVTCIGGGGGGGGCATAAANAAAGGGGGSGGVAISTIILNNSVVLPATVAVVVGAGGPGGTAGANNGITGSTSSFALAANPTSTGGQGGKGSSNTNAPFATGPGGAGGLGSGAAIAIAGGSGGVGVVYAIASAAGGGGGSNLYGAGPMAIVGSSSAGLSATGYGAGGGGAIQVSNGGSFAGGNGADGAVIVEEFY